MTTNITANHSYVLTNALSNNTALDLSLGNNKSIIGFPVSKNPNQQWFLENNGSHWTFKSVGLNTFLSLNDTGPGNGTQLIASTNATIWDIWPDEQDPTTFRIFVPGTDLNIDLSDHGNSTPGAPVIVWSKWNGTNQAWHFQQVS